MSESVGTYIGSRDDVITLLDTMNNEKRAALREMFPGSSSVFVGYEDPRRPGTQIGEIVGLQDDES